MGHRFNDELIQKIKRLDLVEYFQSVAENPHIEKHGNYFTARCPHPDHEDKHPSFMIMPWLKAAASEGSREVASAVNSFLAAVVPIGVAMP